MTDGTVLRWETEDLPDSTRRELLEDVVAESGGESVLVVEADDETTVKEVIEDPTIRAEQPLAGPQFTSVTDPALVIVVIEGAIYLKELRSFGLLAKRKIEERLREQNQSIEQLELTDFA